MVLILGDLAPPVFWGRARRGFYLIWMQVLYFLSNFDGVFSLYIPWKSQHHRPQVSWPISYCYWDMRGQKRPRPNFWNFFISRQILMGFFANDSLWKIQKKFLQAFFVKCTVFCIKGVKGFKKCDFAGDKFLFFIRFWWVFLHLISLNESFQ